MNRDRILDLGLLLLRLALAMVMVYHGSQKVLGLFDGRGPEATLSGWTERHGFPLWLGWLGMLGEFAGGLGVALGLLTRVAALGIAATMSVAVWTHVKGGDPWNKIEFPLALALFAVALLLTGPGRISLDSLLSRGLGRRARG